MFVLQAYKLNAEDNILQLVDPDLGSEYSVEEATNLLKVALLCATASYSARPNIYLASNGLEDQDNFQNLENICSSVDQKNDLVRNHFFESTSETLPRSYEQDTDSDSESIVTELS